MSAALPPGFVDPWDQSLVAAILDGTRESSGRLFGVTVVDLMGRCGFPVVPGTEKGFLRAATPTVVTLGEHRLVLHGPPEHRLEDLHEVRGVTLSRDPIAPDEMPSVVARLLAEAVASAGLRDEASAALTAQRELSGPAGP